MGTAGGAVGYRDYLKAASEQAKAALTGYSESNPEAAQRLKSALAAATELKDQALAKTDEQLAAFAQTDAGQKTVAFVERAQHEVSRLPVITAVADATRSMHGLAPLTQRVVDAPEDPWTHLWLAEALARMKRTQRVTTGARAAIEPSSLVTRTAVAGVSKVGSAGVSVEERLLRRSYVLASRSLGTALSADKLHVLGRVYLAVGEVGHAATALKPALMIGGKDEPMVNVTAARLHFAERRYDDARREAQTALDHGCTLGNEVLADLMSAQATGGVRARAEAVQAAAELRGSVNRQDLIAYYGTFMTTGEALSAAVTSQKSKATETARRVRAATSDMAQQRQPGTGQ